MRLFIAGSNGLHLYEDGELTELSSERALSLVKTNTRRVVVGTESAKILIWDGNSMVTAAKDLGDSVTALAAAADGTLLAGTIPAGAWISKDVGDSWRDLPALARAPGSEDWTAPWGTPLLSTLAPHPKDAKTIYAGVEVGGIYRTRDSGKKWFDLSIPGADVHSIQISPAKHDRVYVTTGTGPFTSDDGGFTWKAIGAANRRRYSMGVAAHPAETDRVVISAAAGPPPAWKGKLGARCDVYLSTDGGKRFRTVVKDLKGGVQRKALVINPKVPSEVAFGTSSGELWYSNDGGESFDRETTRLGDIQAIAFA